MYDATHHNQNNGESSLLAATGFNTRPYLTQHKGIAPLVASLRIGKAEWLIAMLYTHDITRCFDPLAGGTGLSERDFSNILGKTRPSLVFIKNSYENATLPLLRFPEAVDDLASLAEIAQHYRDSFKDVIILGTGGSSLGGRCLYAMADQINLQNAEVPTLHFMDNVDPHSFTVLFASLCPETTGLIVISKSGGTAETLAQLNVTMAWYQTKLSATQIATRTVSIVEPGNSVLRRISSKCQFTTLDHDPQLGGRYSVFSAVGLLPALIIGLNVKSIRQGAADVLQNALQCTNPETCAPAVGAALGVALQQKCAIHNAVLMFYSDRLQYFGQWYRQLWAESLGKNGRGTTPIPFLGTVDQHSQLQLCLDGPKDKFFTSLMTGAAGTGCCIDTAVFGDLDIGPLDGRTMGDLLEASQQGTVDTLAQNGRPVRLIRTEEVNEATLGALMMHFMLETIVAADLMGVDAFDQPAVEQGKKLVRENLAGMKNR